MHWQDATKVAPPRDERVLVWTSERRAEFGYYNETASSSKGMLLPNPEALAIWCVLSGEGRRNIRWWAVVDPPVEP